MFREATGASLHSIVNCCKSVRLVTANCVDHSIRTLACEQQQAILVCLANLIATHQRPALQLLVQATTASANSDFSVELSLA